MKRFSLLPLAEKIWDDNTVYAAYNRKKFRLELPIAAYVIMFAVMLIGFSIDIIYGVFLFGTMFLLASLSSNGTVKHNGKIVENTMWNRIPFTVIGVSLITFCISCFLSDKEETETGADYHPTPASRMVTKLYVAFLISLILGRLIYIIASLISASHRRKNCIYIVLAKYADPPEPNGKVIYTYEYEGEEFYFTYADGISKSFFSMDVSDTLPLNIDPDTPEKFYFQDMTTTNIKKLKHYFKMILVLLLFTSFLWIPLVWVKVIEPLMV